MVYVAIDTNIWIFLLNGEHPQVLDALIDKVSDKKISLVISKIIIDEWHRNKENTIQKMHEAIEKGMKSVSYLSDFLEHVEFKELIKYLKK